jgi:hypothetical protein
MGYEIPDETRAKMRRLATAAGLPYATIVNQRLYDQKTLADTLGAALEHAREDGDQAKVADLSAQLARCRDEIAAYMRELAGAGPAA